MKSRLSTTLKLSWIYAVGNLARRGLHVILLPLYTSYLSTADFGALAMLTVTGGVLSMLISTPLVTGGVMRFYYHPDYRDRQGALVFNLALVTVVLSALVAGAWWLLAEPIAGVLLGAGQPASLVRLYSLALLLWPISELLIMFVKLRSRAKFFVVLSLGECLISAGVIVWGLTVADMGLGAVVLGFIVGMAFTALASGPFLLKSCRFAFSASVLAGPMRFGLPLLPTGLSRLAMQLADRYVLRVFKPLGTVGMYSFAYSLSEVIDTAVGTPVNDGVGPTIRKLESEPDAQRQFIRRSATLYYVLAVMAALAVSLYAREIVMLLARQEEYWPCWVIIPVVSLAFAQQTLGIFLEWGMTMRNKSMHLSGVLLVSAGVNIALNFALIPLMGMMGAAVATVISYLLWNVLRGYYSAKFYDLHFDLRRLSQITIVAVAVYALSLATAGWVGFLVNFAVKAALLAGFAAVCWSTGVLDAGQKQWVAGLWTRYVTRRGNTRGDD